MDLPPTATAGCLTCAQYVHALYVYVGSVSRNQGDTPQKRSGTAGLFADFLRRYNLLRKSISLPLGFYAIEGSTLQNTASVNA